MNRFLKDIADIDTGLRSTLSQLAQVVHTTSLAALAWFSNLTCYPRHDPQFLAVVSILFVVALSTPMVLLMAICLAAPYWFVGQLYRWGARDLKRLSSKTRYLSPIDSPACLLEGSDSPTRAPWQVSHL